jgi:hypothetical protein
MYTDDGDDPHRVQHKRIGPTGGNSQLPSREAARGRFGLPEARQRPPLGLRSVSAAYGPDRLTPTRKRLPDGHAFAAQSGIGAGFRLGGPMCPGSDARIRQEYLLAA